MKRRHIPDPPPPPPIRMVRESGELMPLLVVALIAALIWLVQTIAVAARMIMSFLKN